MIDSPDFEFLSPEAGSGGQPLEAGSPSDPKHLELDFDLDGPHVDMLTEPDPVTLEKRGVTSHRLRRQKAARKAEQQGNLFTSGLLFKDTMVTKLKSIGRGHLADELANCHSQKIAIRCDGCQKKVTVFNRCDRFYCPCCTPRLANERREAVEWWTKEVRQPKHVVLTVRNTNDLGSHHVTEMKKSFSKLRRMKFARNWRGGFYSLEVTNEGKGWHLHIHALVDADWVDAKRLAIAWNQATRGAGHIVKVKDCRSKSYLQEVTKYAVKGSMLASWSAQDIDTFISAFQGKRTFGVFGSLYGKRTEWAEYIAGLKGRRSRCECGCDSFTVQGEREWEFVTAHLIPDVMKFLPPPTISAQLVFTLNTVNWVVNAGIR